MSEYVEISIADRIQQIRINRPDKKNALDLSMYTALADSITGADSNSDVRVSYITGVADAFCSGNDIKDFLNNPPTDESSPVTQFIKAIIGAEKPIVAAVNGIAVGIGTTMLLHFDLVYASEEARFQMPFVNIGLCPEAGSTFLLPVLMGRHKASELLLLGKMFDAREAVALGIANEMVPAEKLKETAMQAARTIVAQPAGSVWVTKGLLRRSVRDLVEAAAKREQDSFIPMLNSPEAKEALSAFMEKRKPDFSKC